MSLIDLTKVPFSMKVEGKMFDVINKEILKEYGSDFLLNSKHHVLIVDMGEK